MLIDTPPAETTGPAFAVRRENGLVVSVTTYPLRIHSVHHALGTLLRQTLRPEKCVLWLAKEEFPGRENDLPESVLSLQEQGLSIGWTENVFSYKKLVPALREYPEKLIVTADDDILYPPEWLERLYADYIAQGRAPMLYAHRAHRIALDDAGALAAYEFWRHAVYNASGKSFFNFSTGGGGVLYPPGALHPDVFDASLFLKLAPHADDIWFWAMAVLNGTFIRVVDNFIATMRSVPLEGEAATQTLWDRNRHGGNTAQLHQVLRHYPDIAVKLLAEVKMLRRR